MTAAKVSVVMPVFNGLPYLLESIQSILSQTHPVDEIVLVDGGSSDGSREWIASLDLPNVVTDFLPAGTPAAATWTRASELASGDFVKLLCQDDVIYPRAVELQLADLHAHPSAGMAIAQRDIITASGRTLFRGRGCAGLRNGLIEGIHALEVGERQGANIFGEPLAVLFRRDSMMEALPWVDEHPFLLDMFFYSKVLQRHDLAVRRESIGAFRISSSSWSTRLADAHRQQFIAWQRHVEREVAPQPWYRIAQARANNEKTIWLRRAAYAWLRRRGDLDPSAG